MSFSGKSVQRRWRICFHVWETIFIARKGTKHRKIKCRIPKRRFGFQRFGIRRFVYRHFVSKPTELLQQHQYFLGGTILRKFLQEISINFIEKLVTY